MIHSVCVLQVKACPTDPVPAAPSPQMAAQWVPTVWATRGPPDPSAKSATRAQRSTGESQAPTVSTVTAQRLSLVFNQD